MSRLTRFDIEQSLLGGKAISWLDGSKRESLQLTKAVQRRLFEFISKSTVRTAKALPDEFVGELKATFAATSDPGDTLTPGKSAPLTPGPWRLGRIDTVGFGGINVWGGPPFSYALDGESIIIDGPNGSGKSSFVGALTWGMQGERARDARAPGVAHERAQVYDDNGDRIGDWPPLACYPAKPGELTTTPSVSVKLTFVNAVGQEAIIERTLRNGKITAVIDPALALPSVLVETGLMMPARLAQIRFGSEDPQLTEAVQMLTGLDEIAALGDFVGELCHKARDFLNYARANRREDIVTQFDDAQRKARDALAAIGQSYSTFKASDTRDASGPMAMLGQQLSSKAATAVGVISADLQASLDLRVATVQQQVAGAIEGAKADASAGLQGLPAWRTISTIASALDPTASASLAGAIAQAAAKLAEALELRGRASADSRFQLKALGAAWHEQHRTDAIESCPLCEQSLKERPELADELNALKSAGAAARRAFRDNLNAILSDLNAAIPSTIRRFSDEVLNLSPRRDCINQLRGAFVDAPRYSAVLTGVSQLMNTALAATPADDIVSFTDERSEEIPDGAKQLMQALAIAKRLLEIAAWSAANQQLWIDWWGSLTAPAAGDNPAGPLSSKLQQLEDALVAWTPYANAANALRSAWKHGQSLDKIDVEQSCRQEIADALEPLKTLRKLADCETKSAIEGLSSRMVKFLDEIYVSERLKFHSAHLEKKTGISVRGGFEPGLRIDATLVANISWIRALLWAFVFSVREEAIEQMGEDRLPLLVLDDPQATFDLTHRHRWIQRIAALQRGNPGLQIILATHDEPFLDQLSTLHLSGRRVYLSAAAQDTGHILLADGTTLERLYAEAMTLKTPAAARSYIERTRIHIEAVLKVMLRGEAETRGMTLGKLRERIHLLHKNSVQPWNRSAFRDLVNKLDGPPEIKHLESSHHSTGSTLGMAEAIDVEDFWRLRLSPTLERAFRQIREYRLLHGESKALFADPAIVAMPNGHRDVVRSIPLALVGRAAALTTGRLADGELNISDLAAAQRTSVVLGDHEAFRLVTPTLEPVARPGDILIVAAHGKVPVGSLVVAGCSEHLLARRFQVAIDHPEVAVLVAQAVTPSRIAPPFIAHLSTVLLRRVVGILFDPSAYPVSAPPNCEVADCGGDAALKGLIRGSVGVVEVSGDSAEPQALNGQYLLVGDQVTPENACRTLNEQPVLATDSKGNHFFKRLRCLTDDLVILESLHSGGQFPPVLLAMPGRGEPYLGLVAPVIGVLFEL